MARFSGVRHIQNGRPVNAGEASRPDRDLESLYNYLLSLLDAADRSEALFARDVTVESAAKVGMPVYWATSAGRFERALAGAETDATTGTLRATAASFPVGIVYSKSSATTADLLLAGTAELAMTEAISGTITDGLYFLSTQTAGYLTKEQPYASVPVLQVCDDKVFVQIDTRDFLENHTHYRIALVCQPAGEYTATNPGEYPTIAAPNTIFPGWLPADHESFDGKAPVGAAFGYNMAAHPALERIWPPVPLSAASFTWDKGQGLVGGTDVPLGQTGLVVANTNGIWWMSPCHEDVPWPNQDFTEAGLSSSIGAVSISSLQECSRNEEMRLLLHFAKYRFATNRTAVTSLEPDTGEPLEFVNQDNEVATTGCLKARLRLDWAVDTESDSGGSRFVTTYDTETRKFLTSRAVSKITVGNGLSLTGTDPDEATAAADAVAGQGRLHIALSAADQEILVTPLVVHVFAAKTRYEEMVPYVGFVAATTASARWSFQVPFTGLPSNPTFKLRLWLFGTTAGTIPTMTASYRVLPRPDGVTPVSLPSSDTSLTIDTNQTISTNAYLEVESATVDVDAGDLVLVSLNRSSADGYAGEVGIISAVLVVEEGDA